MMGVKSMQGFEKMLKMAGIDVGAMKQQATDWFQKLGAKLTEHDKRLATLETQFEALVNALRDGGHIEAETVVDLLQPFYTHRELLPEQAVVVAETEKEAPTPSDVMDC